MIVNSFDEKMQLVRNSNKRIKEMNKFKQCAKSLMIDYKQALLKKNQECENLKKEYLVLKNNYDLLKRDYERIPRLIKKIFG